MSYKTSYANGERDDVHETYDAAKRAIYARWPQAEIGHDGDLDGFGDHTLFWVDAESSVDDDGARALGSIRKEA